MPFDGKTRRWKDRIHAQSIRSVRRWKQIYRKLMLDTISMGDEWGETTSLSNWSTFIIISIRKYPADCGEAYIIRASCYLRHVHGLWCAWTLFDSKESNRLPVLSNVRCCVLPYVYALLESSNGKLYPLSPNKLHSMHFLLLLSKYYCFKPLHECAATICGINQNDMTSCSTYQTYFSQQYPHIRMVENDFVREFPKPANSIKTNAKAFS